jgi:FixJ family two-component response regulator
MGLAANERRTATPVWLLDDDPSVLKATGRLLRAAGWGAKTFSDPQAFLLEAQREQPAVAVLDILMPVMNGLEVQTRLRQIAPATRVIVLTSKDDPFVHAKAMEGGASAFIPKSADDEEFLGRIGAVLAGHEF